MTRVAPDRRSLLADSSRRMRPRHVVWMLAGIAGLVGVVALRHLTAADGPWDLPNAGQDLLTLATSVLVESLPFIVLGITLSIIVQVWVPQAWLMQWLPRNAVGRRAIISMFGMFLPVCECGNVPLARGLVRRGFSVPESMTFLIAAPILNPVVIITTHQAFGFDDGILVARLLGGFLIANLIGWLYAKHPEPETLLTARFAEQCRIDDESHEHPTKWQQTLDLFVRETSILMPALVIGALVAGGIQVIVPREILVALGSDPLWSIVAMMVLAFIISVCSSVDAFFILPFAATFLPGSIVTFLVFGPIIDIKMLALMRTTYSTQTLIQITTVVGLVAAALGLMVNYVA
ncbi:hypothetical protein EV140_1015 [Microcella alkaliphila]|uniref:Permease n=2 Tax=Microcella alkaliphila TaxID=279828 RepID=A0A4Q7TNS9_9MICO|nr:permease [Microcella alkaliphila]RZT62486.1 hypothetical protein EV140_1015 [Microcella alkaliphila]